MEGKRRRGKSSMVLICLWLVSMTVILAFGIRKHHDCKRFFLDKPVNARPERTGIPRGAVPEPVIQTGHSDSIDAIAFSPDGKFLISGSTDGTTKLWSSQDGKEIRTLRASGESVIFQSLSYDGKLLATAGGKDIIMWDFPSLKKKLTLRGCSGIAFSPDGKTVAVVKEKDDSKGMTGRSIELVDLRGMKPAIKIARRVSPLISNLSFSPDGRMLAAGESHDIRIWDVATGEELRTLSGSDSFSSIAFSRGGDTLARGTGTDDGIGLWDVSTGERLGTLEGHKSSVSGVAFSPDDNLLASASDDKTVRLWNVKSGKETRIFRGHTSGVSCVAFSPDGKTLASGSSDRSIRLWDMVQGVQSCNLRSHSSWIFSVALSPDGTVLETDSNDMIRHWDVAGGTRVRAGMKTGNTPSIDAITLSRDGKRLARIDEERIVIWDVVSNRRICNLGKPQEPISCAVFSPDGRVLATGSRNGTIRLRDTEMSREMRTFKDHYDQVNSIAFSEDGRLLASASLDDTVRIMDAATGKELRVLEIEGPQFVAFGAGGKTVIARERWKDAIKIWNLADGTEEGTESQGRPA